MLPMGSEREMASKAAAVMAMQIIVASLLLARREALAPRRSPAVVGVGPLASSALIDVNSQPLGSNERDAQALRLVINRAEWHRLGDGVSMALCFSQ